MEYVTKETLDLVIEELNKDLISRPMCVDETLLIRGGLEAFKFLRENHLTSDKLRPMSEAPKDTPILVSANGATREARVMQLTGDVHFSDPDLLKISIDKSDGWRPI